MYDPKFLFSNLKFYKNILFYQTQSYNIKYRYSRSYQQNITAKESRVKEEPDEIKKMMKKILTSNKGYTKQ